MKFEETEVWGFEHALRGMRNPKESWNKSDSINNQKIVVNSLDEHFNCTLPLDKIKKHYLKPFKVGNNDMKLAQTLIRAGSEHRKFMRQIFVAVDITAPLYWWKEFDTYKVGTVANSTSTMHKLATTPITLDCFEIDDFNKDINADCIDKDFNGELKLRHWAEDFINDLESLRQSYLFSKDKRYWKELIRWLPESWLQKRTVTMTYENLLAICSKEQRRFHKLNEWSGADNQDVPNFISWARSLPYAKELIFIDEGGVDIG